MQNQLKPTQVDELIKTLLQNENNKGMQISIIKKIPLLDGALLLILIVISLISEWFIRKHNARLQLFFFFFFLNYRI
jgi:hypothetical protein